MKLKAYKYQGAGNDFVILDNRKGKIILTKEQIAFLCDRRFGIGADGLMLLEESRDYDFKMRYFNADGAESSMCGNGGRCLVAFAAYKGIKSYIFEAIDGLHIAEILDIEDKKSIIRLRMIDVTDYKKYNRNSFFLNTGSPHLVIFCDNIDQVDIEKEGKIWRHHKDFPVGTNVNFVEISENRINVRTFERGVEAETLACGTGVTATAISIFLNSIENNISNEATNPEYKHEYKINTIKDCLKVDFKYSPERKFFHEVFLTGPATFVFKTKIEL